MCYLCGSGFPGPFLRGKDLKLKITVCGAGYVGMAVSLLLSAKNNVTVYDIDEDRVRMLNEGKTTVRDPEAEKAMSEGAKVKATTWRDDAYKDAELIILALPTNFDKTLTAFNTSIIEKELDAIRSRTSCPVVIKSTVPIGFTEKMNKKHKNVMFSPEFLREGHALYDNWYPSRVIVGGEDIEEAHQFAKLVLECTKKENVPVRLMSAADAEAVKLFSNSYLALRIAFFNELDTFAEEKGLNSINIIRGMGDDPRIGDMYNMPSFGYGGYCLPKDTMQLRSNFEEIPERMIDGTIKSNEARIKHIAEKLKDKSKGGTIGIYRLTMKEGSDNFRESASIFIMKKLVKAGCKVVIYEPTVKADTFNGVKVIKNLDVFCKRCSVIAANRVAPELGPYMEKVYTREFER